MRPVFIFTVDTGPEKSQKIGWFIKNNGLGPAIFKSLILDISGKTIELIDCSSANIRKFFEEEVKKKVPNEKTATWNSLGSEWSLPEF